MHAHPDEVFDSAETLHQLREERTRDDELRSKRWEAFERLRQLRERIAQNHPGVDFGDSTEIIRQMREERSQYLADL